jgi:RimJ/RimL family protein N-acetyltransferase
VEIGGDLISGRLVKLKRLGLQHLPYIYKLRNDKKLMSFYDLFPCSSMFKIEKTVKNEIKSKDRLDFVVQTLKCDVIGAAWLKRIDWRGRACEINIMISEKKHRLTVYGAEAGFLLLKYTMSELNMHKVYSKITEFALESQRLLLDAGFKREAILRKAFYQNGKYWDLYLYGMLQREFESFFTTPRMQRYLTSLRRE